jgi:cytochrome c-type biogenesis protein CcmH
MLFWILALAATLGIALLLALTLLRGRTDPGAALVVYRDQLDEVERDRARGVLTEDEAGRLRAEVARRLLAADRSAQAEPGEARQPGPAAAVLLAVTVIAAAVGTYLWLGQPDYPDQPLSARLERPSQAEAEAQWGEPWEPPAQADPQYLDLVARLRETMAGRPDDPTGLDLLAAHEQALGNYAAAHRALVHLLELKGDAATAAEWSRAAMLMVAAAGGFVSPEAEVALAQALRRDAADPTARYYTGLLYAQTRRPGQAFQVWQPLLEQSPPDAPWVAAIRADIEAVAAAAGIDYAPPPLRGPSAADLEAAGDMDEAERADMIRGMVEGLAARLAADGGPAPDWARLIVALSVLGEEARAREILAEARGVFAADPAGLAALDAAAREAGLE